MGTDSDSQRPGSGDPPGPAPEDPGEAGADDPLRALEERITRASEAAERLIADAAAAATRKPPPAGWQRPAAEGADRAGTASAEGFAGDAELLLGVLAALRDRIPAELAQRLGDALREVLLAVRALIDWYLERTERHREEPAEVRDIPIL